MAANSPQARHILDALDRLDHPTADEVFLEVRRHMPKVSLATVYRNLAQLVDDGDARLRDIGGQMRYDRNTHPHVHIHDTRTDRLLDVPLTPKLREALDEIATAYLADHEDSIIELRGHLREKTP